MRSDEFANLVGAAWTLIGHEREATKDMNNAFMSEATIKKFPTLDERAAYFEKIGRGK